MQELERILEEIEQRKARAEKLIVKPPQDKLDQIANDTAEAFIEAYKECQDIISKHMNDGWTPVEEALPDNNENVLVTTDMGLIASGYIAHGTWITDQEPDYPIAWRPLPEPYHLEPETEKPDWRRDMLRKFDRRE